MTMAKGKLTIFDRDGCLLTEVQRTEGRLYLLKLSIIDHCLITTKDSFEDWLWHSRLGHLSFHKLKEMSRKKIVDGLSTVNMPNNSAQVVLQGNIIGRLFQNPPLFEQLSH